MLLYALSNELLRLKGPRRGRLRESLQLASFPCVQRACQRRASSRLLLRAASNILSGDPQLSGRLSRKPRFPAASVSIPRPCEVKFFRSDGLPGGPCCRSAGVGLGPQSQNYGDGHGPLHQLVSLPRLTVNQGERRPRATSVACLGSRFVRFATGRLAL